MNVWDLVLLPVAALGFETTAWLAWTTRKDREQAPSYLLDRATQYYRHEIFRLVKCVLLFIALAMPLFVEQLGVETVRRIRDTIIVVVMLLLTINSMWDMWWRLSYDKRLKARLQKEKK